MEKKERTPTAIFPLTLYLNGHLGDDEALFNGATVSGWLQGKGDEADDETISECQENCGTRRVDSTHEEIPTTLIVWQSGYW